MCDHSICPAGREGIYIISKQSYIEWAQPIYRICSGKYIDTPSVPKNRGRFLLSSTPKKSADTNDFFHFPYCASDIFLL